jgi:transposase
MSHSLYQWVKKYSVAALERQEAQGHETKIRKLKVALKRVTEERDIVKMAGAVCAADKGARETQEG